MIYKAVIKFRTFADEWVEHSILPACKESEALKDAKALMDTLDKKEVRVEIFYTPEAFYQDEPDKVHRTYIP